MTITVLVADDQPLVRAGLAMLLSAQPDLEVVGEASDGRETIQLAQRLRPDVVLMDLRMPVLDGAEATRVLVREQADSDRLVKVLVLTTFNDDDAVYGALTAGASGFLLKHAAPADLVAAIRRVAAGESWIDPAVAGQVIKALSFQPVSQRNRSAVLERLTSREREVLSLLAYGLSVPEISERFVLSEATVKTHVARILIKTGSRDRAQAVTLAYQSGLVVPGGQP